MSTDRVEVYASPQGSVFGDGSRGYPVRDLHSALRLLRQRREPGQRAVVWLSGGTYPQTETVEFTPEDSFTTIAALDPAAPPVFDGSVAVTGWREITLNGAALVCAPAPRATGRSLYVDGQRAPRPRYPREGFLRIEEQPGLDPTAEFVSTLFDGSASFRYAEGDIPELADPGRVEVVVPHYWVQERMPIERIDRDTRTVTSSLRSIFALRDDAAQRFARYYLENVVESLGEVPGEWYLDATGLAVGAEGPHLVYVPRPGERVADLDVRLPVLDTFVRLAGDPATGQFVREVRFEGVHFQYADFDEVPAARAPFGVREDPVLPRDVAFASEVQAASEVPGAIQFFGARGCAFVDGAIEHVGGYGIQLAPGTRGTLISGSRFADLGAGAVRSGGSIDPLDAAFNRDNEVSDNDIEGGGRVYPNCVAVLFQHGSHNVIAHNHIRDFFYTGISVGWMWDYSESPSQANLITGNHIHDIGQGLLNDMGGIYLLGIAPGTVVSGNRIHDVRCANYGGWGIYLDEGSSHVVIEGNVVYDVSSQAYHHHYGRENIIRDNVWAFAGQGQVSVTRLERHVAFTFERNIVVGSSSPGFCGTPGPRDARLYSITSDLNLFWDYAPIEGAVRAGNGEKDSEMVWSLTERLDVDWAAAGHDRHSLTADPLFLDATARDFRVAGNSPAHELGIRVPDVSGAGPRAGELRLHPLAPLTRRDQFAPSQG